MRTMEMNERIAMEGKSDQIDHDNDVQEEGRFLSSYDEHQKGIGIIIRCVFSQYVTFCLLSPMDISIKQ